MSSGYPVTSMFLRNVSVPLGIAVLGMCALLAVGARDYRSEQQVVAQEQANRPCECECREQFASMDGRIYNEEWAEVLCEQLRDWYPCAPPYCGERTVRVLARTYDRFRGQIYARWIRVDMHVPGGDPGMGFMHQSTSGTWTLVVCGTLWDNDFLGGRQGKYIHSYGGWNIPVSILPEGWR